MHCRGILIGTIEEVVIHIEQKYKEYQVTVRRKVEKKAVGPYEGSENSLKE